MSDSHRSQSQTLTNSLGVDLVNIQKVMCKTHADMVQNDTWGGLWCRMILGRTLDKAILGEDSDWQSAGEELLIWESLRTEKSARQTGVKWLLSQAMMDY